MGFLENRYNRLNVYRLGWPVHYKAKQDQSGKGEKRKWVDGFRDWE